MAVVIPLAVPPMRLMIVILDKTSVGLFRALPGRDLLEMIITHPSHNREVTLNQIFPALLFVDPLFLDL